MPVPSTGPKIPLGLGEMLYISLNHVLNYVKANGHYPDDMADSIRKLLSRYENDRTGALLMQGIPGVAIDRYTEFTALKWGKWMTEEREKHRALRNDFDLWAKELESGE